MSALNGLSSKTNLPGAIKPSRLQTHPLGRGHFGVLSVVLLISGFCSLTYQVVWIREFRMIFGGTTASMAVVISVFMAGLGIGGALLGKRAERSAQPLRLYAWIEIGIAVFTALSPFLLVATRGLYYQTGGETGLGYGIASLLRGGITVIVIGLPCFLMGGTLPAMAKHLQHDADRDRRVTGWLYGINIWGGLIGVAFTTFFALEFFGSRNALWFATFMNLAIGLLTLGLARQRPAGAAGVAGVAQVTRDTAAHASEPIPAGWAYGAAFLTGFSFFAMELVWYRVSIPLTGGSVYALGMVLMVVLLGLGMGGGLYALLARRIGHSPAAFALIAALQTAMILLPYLLGDWFAWSVAMMIDAVMGQGFLGVVSVWFLTVAALALPASILAGMQFPLLLSLLGRGNVGVGSQLGQAYAWNTAGAIAGSLLGGFILLPWIGAEGLWIGSAAIVALLSLIFLLRHLRFSDAGFQACWHRLPLSVFALLLALIVGVTLVKGPGALWRNSQIGFGGFADIPKSVRQCTEYFALLDGVVVEFWEGRETSVAVFGSDTRAVLTNGKSEGSLHGGAATTIGLALIPAVLHREGLRTGAVIGMGTGVSPGWLAAFPGVEQVDVMEIEPAMIEAGKWFTEGNLDPLGNPKVRVILGDARETMATNNRSYDVIISCPSNLNRSGVCNLYTVEFYTQCARRMNEGGMFVQWIQGNDIDPLSLAQAVKTMASIFPSIQLWMPEAGNIVLLGSFDTAPYDLEQVKLRLEDPVIRRAMNRGFLTDSAEGFFSRFFIGSDALRNTYADNNIPLNRDDRNSLEFRFARSALAKHSGALQHILDEALSEGNGSKEIDGELAPSLLQMERGLLQGYYTIAQSDNPPGPEMPVERAMWYFFQGRLDDFQRTWNGQPKNLRIHLYFAVVAAVSRADIERDLGQIQEDFPAETKILRGLNHLLQNKNIQGAILEIENGLAMQHELGWSDSVVMKVFCNLLPKTLPNLNRAQQERLFNTFEKPFPSDCLRPGRIGILAALAELLGGQYPERLTHARLTHR